ncbi:hypothetical protein V8G54_008654 [Vigna mungo]|uniref:Uncharacterized protein n=1 Tax=Vigna mungo TaxID=3915 RepID=A0AAQ3S8E8_VIGMU
MGELKFFLGLQIKQEPNIIFIHQTKYLKEPLKKFKLDEAKEMKTPMHPTISLRLDESSTKEIGLKGKVLIEDATSLEATLYHGRARNKGQYPFQKLKQSTYQLQVVALNFYGSRINLMTTRCIEWDTPILPKFVMQFWFKVELHSERLTSKVISKEVKDDLFVHKGTVERVLYDTNFSRHLLGIEVVYRQMTPYDKVFQLFCSKMFLHKNNLRDHVIELGRYVIYHLMTVMPFNLPNVIYINLIRSIKNLHKDVY